MEVTSWFYYEVIYKGKTIIVFDHYIFYTISNEAFIKKHVFLYEALYAVLRIKHIWRDPILVSCSYLKNGSHYI